MLRTQTQREEKTMKNRFWLVAGLVLAELALCAAIVGVFWNSVGWLKTGGVRVRAFELDQASAQEQAEQRLPVSGPATLRLTNTAGDVNVQTGGDAEVVVTFTKTAWGSDQAEAEARLDDLKVSVTQAGDEIKVIVTQPEEINFIGDHRSGQVDFTITVPARTQVTAQSGFGDLTLAGTTGDATLHTGSGAVTARSLTGSLDLRSDFGDVTVEDATGETVKINSSSGKLQLDRVQAAGRLEAHSDFGVVTVRDGGAAELDASSSSGDITLTNLTVAGTATANTDFGSLRLTQVLAEAYDLETSSGDVTVEGGRGPLKAHTDFGDVDVSGMVEASVDLFTSSGSVVFEGALGPGPHTLKSEFGGVRLTLPAGTAVTFDLSTDFGSIRSQFPVTLNGGQGLDDEHWRGTLNGGGESLTVHTSSGDISLNQAQS
jgi:DUF4097 and DUF4098 domain-containing protein YvlB